VSWLRLLRGDRGEAERLTREAIKVSSEQGIPVYLANGRIIEGALRAAEGEAKAGVRMIEAGEQERARAILAPVYGRFTEGFETRI
jgi:hypothetical protein